MSIKKELPKVVQENPDLTIKELAERFDTTSSYIRHILSLEDLRLTDLREERKKRKETNIDVKRHIVDKLKGEVLRVDLDWVDSNDKIIKDLFIEKFYEVEMGVETGDISKEQIDEFNSKVKEVEYIFTDEGIIYCLILKDEKNKLVKKKLFKDEYWGLDWEILIPYMIELGLI